MIEVPFAATIYVDGTPVETIRIERIQDIQTAADRHVVLDALAAEQDGYGDSFAHPHHGRRVP